MGTLILAGLTVAGIILVKKTFLIVAEREAVVKERLGKFQEVLKPGFHFMVPLMDRAAYKQEVREQAINVPPQSCITRDNIQVEVDGIVYLKVVDGKKASYGIENYRNASINLAQTTMRSEIGKISLDDTFSGRDQINDNIVQEIDKASDDWGIKMLRYEIMNITPSRRVVDTMEKQMEAERDKRAQVLMSSGQKEAAILLSEGERIADIALSVGKKQSMINRATGRAEEIRAIASASAEGIRVVAEAFQKPGGNLAMKTQIMDEFMTEYQEVLAASDVRVVPQGVAEMKTFFEGMGQVSLGLKGDK